MPSVWIDGEDSTTQGLHTFMLCRGLVIFPSGYYVTILLLFSFFVGGGGGVFRGHRGP